jgi:hypothetical protein
MSKHKRGHQQRDGARPVAAREAFGSRPIGPFLVNSEENSIALDVSKVEGPDRVYDADVGWIEHRSGTASLVFAKFDRDEPGQLKSRLEVRYPPEDLLLTFWGNSRSFFGRLRSYVSKWDAESRQTTTPPLEARAAQSHSEWASFTYMSHSGSEAALDFYHIAPSALAIWARNKETRNLKLRSIVRVQMTTFELYSLILRVQTALDEIRAHIPESHSESKKVLGTFEDEADTDAAREYGS